MNSKQRRQKRREGEKESKLIKRMNDFCPMMYRGCRDPNKVFNFDCFGKYLDCPYYRKV